jgi:putative FmdB family regulatory protein
MPIYEYKCGNGHIFEAKQRMSDDALTECEICGGPVQRLLFPPAIHFKGSGFYNTDYGTKRRAREKAAQTAKDKEASASKSETSASKPAAESKAAKPSSSSAAPSPAAG